MSLKPSCDPLAFDTLSGSIPKRPERSMAHPGQMGLDELESPQQDFPRVQLRDITGFLKRVDRFTPASDTKGFAWDADGTLIKSELLHRQSFWVATCELTGFDFDLTEKVWKELSKKAWNLPELGSCHEIATQLASEEVRKAAPHLFLTARRSSAVLELTNRTDVETVALALMEKRREVINYFLENGSVHEQGTGLNLKRTIFLDRSKEWGDRGNMLKFVTVGTYPGVLYQTAKAKERGLFQGVCSSSSGTFIAPVLRKIGILDRFDAGVGAEHVREGMHKPKPYPWQVLLSSKKAKDFGITNAHQVVGFENSAGGLYSLLRTGMQLVASAENNHKLMRELCAKLLEDQYVPRSPIPFVPNWTHVKTLEI